MLSGPLLLPRPSSRESPWSRFSQPATASHTKPSHSSILRMWLGLIQSFFTSISSITELTNFLEAVQAWMGNNKLKTEFIVIGDLETRSCLKSSFPMSLLDNIMEPAESVKILGVILDAENSVQRHVANLCRISYYHLH